MMWSTAVAVTVHFRPRIWHKWRSRSRIADRSLRQPGELMAPALAVGVAVTRAGAGVRGRT